MCVEHVLDFRFNLPKKMQQSETVLARFWFEMRTSFRSVGIELIIRMQTLVMYEVRNIVDF